MSQKTNSMLKLALVFFICLLSFSIGTYVGKKYSDNQYKLSQLEPGKKDGHGHEAEGGEFASNAEGEEHAAAAGEGHEAKHEGTESKNLTDSEVAKIAEEFASEPAAEASHDEKAIQTTEADEKEIKTINEKPQIHIVKPMPSKSATAVAKATTAPTAHAVAAATNESHAATSETTREPSSIRPSSGMHYTVQIGSFPAETDAQKMTKDLLAKGIKTSYVPAQVNGQTYYRVNVGLFGTVKEADDYKKGFLEKTKMTSAFVQKVQ